MASLALVSYYSLGITFLLLCISACKEVKEKCNCLFIFISSKPLIPIGLEA